MLRHCGRDCRSKVLSHPVTVCLLTTGTASLGLVVKASASGAEDPGFESRLRRDFPGSGHTSDLKLALQWLPRQGPDVIRSALGLVGPVSVYCD